MIEDFFLHQLQSTIRENVPMLTEAFFQQHNCWEILCKQNKYFHIERKNIENIRNVFTFQCFIESSNIVQCFYDSLKRWKLFDCFAWHFSFEVIFKMFLDINKGIVWIYEGQWINLTLIYRVDRTILCCKTSFRQPLEHSRQEKLHFSRQEKKTNDQRMMRNIFIVFFSSARASRKFHLKSQLIFLHKSFGNKKSTTKSFHRYSL